MHASRLRRLFVATIAFFGVAGATFPAQATSDARRNWAAPRWMDETVYLPSSPPDEPDCSCNLGHFCEPDCGR
jgi:hypothetical protein